MSCFEAACGRDRLFHYSDGSHNWIAPLDLAQEVWDAGIRAHLDRHRREMDASTYSPGVRRVSVAATKPVTWP